MAAGCRSTHSSTEGPGPSSDPETAGNGAATTRGETRDAEAELSKLATGVYMSDVTVGELPQLRGHWLDRLPAIDRDIKAIAEKLNATKPGQTSATVAMIIREVLGRAEREVSTGRHVPASRFVPGKPLEVDLTVAAPVASVNLYYRHVNQAERFKVAAMDRSEHQYHTAIPGAYTDSAYPLQYYFEIKTTTGRTLIFPGFAKGLLSQPYIVVRRT